MILLIILVVALIYFIKINSDDEIIEVSNFEVSDEVKEDATNLCKGAYDDEKSAIIDLQSITKELENEGLARETISKVQQLRKTMNFDITDRINMYIDATSEYKENIKMPSIPRGRI